MVFNDCIAALDTAGISQPLAECGDKGLRFDGVAYREWIHTQHGIFADLIPVMPMLTRYAVFALAPVVVTLVLGIAGAWIVSGFRQGKS